MTTVTLMVTDPSLESDTDQVTITVEDTTSPTVSVAASPESLWPPNHKYKGITGSPPRSSYGTGSSTTSGISN